MANGDSKARFLAFLDEQGVLPNDPLRSATPEQLVDSDPEFLLQQALVRAQKIRGNAIPSQQQPQQEQAGLGAFDRLKRAEEVVAERQRIKNRQ